MKKKFIILGSFVITLIFVTSAAWLIMEGHGFNFDGYAQVRDGMTTSQIEKLMGAPSSVEKLKNGVIVWQYANQWKWCIGYVYFDQDNKVTGKEHDH